MDRRQKIDLDNYITGHYGEDQFKGIRRKTNFPTPWAVWCPWHKKIYLDRKEYLRQLNQPDAAWQCPICRGESRWDDENYEEWGDNDD